MKKTGNSGSGRKKKNDLSAKTDGFLITGIGASAGGVEALIEFFQNVPADSGIAYVVILHLSPDHDSQLTEILANVASIPVAQVTERVKVEPNHVYVISPNSHLEMLDGHIDVSPNLTTQDRRAPVDIFFRTLAESHGPRAVGVVLSGTGANGSMGIKRIKERGGAAFVQNPREARFNEMPRNSIATELIDDIVAVAALPSCIIAYKERLGNTAIPEEVLIHPETSQQALRDIFTQLRVRTGHDFSNYKRPTLLRRIERRINIRNLSNLSTYAGFVTENPDEAHSLLKDLLISVTNFFRDKKPFDAIEHNIMPRIFNDKKGTDQVRIWVAGCATGEEAYSIAMLCAERIENMIEPPKVQIFATDIDEDAISTARAGAYTINDAADVSPERLQRFFSAEGEQYVVRREIREMVIFATHNVLKDPPFSHLDMATCRNMLIYLNGTAQGRVMETLHFALNPGGFLFLGTSESVDGSGDLYTIVSREDHIYQSQSIGKRHIPVSDSMPSAKRESKQQISIQNDKGDNAKERITYGELHHSLLEQYAPPSIIVNAEYDILHVSDRAGRFLQVAGGELSRNLLKLIRPELRLELRTAFYQASQRNMPTEAHNLKVTIDERPEIINIKVRPVMREGDAAHGFMLVIFEQNHDGEAEERAYISDEPLARQLEEELIRVKSQLRASSDQYEVQAEELKATNEELQAMNEELRSAAEELETSKEELQSINEELRTVNQELKVKIEEVSLTSNNLQNLINSANIGTIFLDRSFRVMLYTPAALQIFNLIPADYSRALSDITNRLKEDRLLEDAQAVLDKLSVVEREMTVHDGRVFFVRYSPYRTEDDRILGVVITFLDITARKHTEESLQKTHDRLRQAMDAGRIFSWEMNPETRHLEWSDNMEEVIGFKLRDNIDKTFQLFHPDDAAFTENAINSTVETGIPYASEYRIVNPANGQESWFSSIGAMKNNVNDGQPRFVGITQNITERKQSEKALRESEQRFRLMIDTVPQMIWIASADGSIEFFNKWYYDYTGITEAQTTVVQVAADVLHPDDAPKVLAAFDEARRTGKGFEIEQRNKSEKGEYKWFLNRAEPYHDPRTGAITRWFGVGVDIHDRKQAQQAQQESEARFRTVTDVVPQIIWANDGAGKANYFNERWYEYSGLGYEQSVGLGWEAIVHPDDAPASVNRWQKALKAGKVFDTEYRLRNSAGHYRWFIGRNVPLRSEAGEVAGWFGSATDIEELKQVQEALHISRERLHVTVESATEFAIITFNTEGNIEGWNSGAARIFGYLEADVIGKSAEIIFTPEDREAGAPAMEFREARENGSAKDERWHLRSNGEKFYMSGVLAPIYDGALTGYVKVARDMTTQKQAEEALATSEELNRVALQSAKMGAWEWNLIEDKVKWNDQHYHLLGLEPQREVKNSEFFLRFIHPDDGAMVNSELLEATKSGLYEVDAFRIVRPDGIVRWMSGYGRVIEWQDGKAARMVGVMFDVTGRIESEQELRDKQLQLEISQRAARVGIWGYDLKLRQGIATPELLELTGYPHPGATWDLGIFLTLVHSEDRAGLRDAYRTAAAGHSALELEFRIEHPQRGIQWMLMRGQYIPPYDKMNETLMGSLIDITERKLFEEQKDAFIGIASHELRTPVTSIKSYAEMLEEMFVEAGDTNSAELMRKLDGQVDRLTELIHALLDTTSIVDGRMQLHMSTFGIDTLIAEAADAMKLSNGTHKIDLELSANTEIFADRERIRQVIINLLGNAIKYSPKADSIKVSTTSDEKEVTICVQDQGIGIPEEVHHKIFDRFYRSGDAQASTFSGLGLGLFISAGIVHNHKGTISVKSKKGDGAVFCFTLPYSQI